jgi:putative nucleotidyltransferase with HDIG domain
MHVDFAILDPETVVRRAFEMPALPQSTVRLASIIANENVELIDVVQVIECDPALTLKLLRVANSVYSSSSRSIGTVKDAVIRLGTGAVLGLAIGSCVQPAIVRVLPGYNISGSDFWRHSLATALSTECLRAYTRVRVSPLAFTTALLHDIGKLVLGNFLNAEVCEYLENATRNGKLSAFEAESEILSMHHGEVGGVIAQHWGLPEAVVKGITFHHTPELCEESIGYLVHLSNYVAHRVSPVPHFGNEELPDVAPIDISNDLKELGLMSESIAMISTAVRDRLAAVSAEFE